MYFDGLFLSKAYNVSTRKFHRNCVFKEKLSGGLRTDIRNLVNFHASSRKSENLHFDGLVLSKAYKVLVEKVQKSYAS